MYLKYCGTKNLNVIRNVLVNNFQAKRFNINKKKFRNI